MQGNQEFRSTATRELRANNPFGVSLSSTYKWENIDTTKTVPDKNGACIMGVDNELGDKLVIFKTFQDGLNSGFWLLWTYFTSGLNTAEEIGDRWAGDTEAKADAQHRKSYGEDVTEIMDDPFVGKIITYISNGVDVAKAIMRMENGALIWYHELVAIPQSMYDSALEYGQRTKTNG